MIAATVATCVRFLPLYGLIETLSQLDPALLKPCNEGCTFIRYWGTPSMPRSTPRNRPACDEKVDAGCVEIPDDSSSDGRPAFMTVTNGLKPMNFSTNNAPWLFGFNFPTSIQQSYTLNVLKSAQLFSGGGDLIEEITSVDVLHITADSKFKPALCPGKDPAKMKELCASIKTKQQVSKEGNHLTQAVCLRLYKVFLITWAVIRLIHDLLLLCESPAEVFTISVGFVAFFVQVCALSAGFLWCIGAAEVFSATLEEGRCACYYEMDTLPMFGVIGTPLSLYLMTRNKLWKLFYSCLHGDYLYSVNYSIPYRCAHQNNNDPTYDFLQQHRQGGVDKREARKQGLTCREYRMLSKGMNLALTWFNVQTLYFVYSFAFPSLTVRLYDVVVVGFARSGLQAMDVAAWLFFAFAAGAPIYAVYGVCQMAKDWFKWMKSEREAIQRVPSLTAAQLVRDYNPMYEYNHWIPQLVEGISFILVGWMAFNAYYLPIHLQNGTEITATHASAIGAAGFYLLCAFLRVWVPSDTPYRALQWCVFAKGATWLPVGGFEQLRTMNETYPHLGLQDVVEIANVFADRYPESPLLKHGLLVEKSELQKWTEFAQPRLDQGKKGGAAPVCELADKYEPLT